MKKNLIISSVAAFAALNPEGFTVNAANLQPVTTGFAVALKRTQNSSASTTTHTSRAARVSMSLWGWC